MAHQLLTFSIAAQTAIANAMATLMNGGSVNLYSGQRPINPDVPVASFSVPPVLLATISLPNPVFATAANGFALANAISPVTPILQGHPDWFRAFKSDGITAVVDGTCGNDGSADMWLTTQYINSSITTVGITAWYFRPSTPTAYVA